MRVGIYSKGGRLSEGELIREFTVGTNGIATADKENSIPGRLTYKEQTSRKSCCETWIVSSLLLQSRNGFQRQI